jgi:hypothetical protein
MSTGLIKRGYKMSIKETKAAELVDLGRQFGFEPQVDHYAYYSTVRFNGNLVSRITMTDTGLASVKSWDRTGRASESVSLKALPEYLKYYSQDATKSAQSVFHG